MKGIINYNGLKFWIAIWYSLDEKSEDANVYHYGLCFPNPDDCKEYVKWMNNKWKHLRNYFYLMVDINDFVDWHRRETVAFYEQSEDNN